MFNLQQFVLALEQVAPLSLSQKMIEKGNYDNSGIIVHVHDEVSNVLFSLDLSGSAVEYAKSLGCDTIVTHHPAIYAPIKSLSLSDDTRALVLAVNSKINVVSMHLNLDVAKEGVDACLAKGLGAKNTQIIDTLTENEGYGRVFTIEEIAIKDFVCNAEKVFDSNKIIYYGHGNVRKVASFCGSGAQCAVQSINRFNDVDTVVTSDIAHHHLKELIEKGKNVVFIPHYVSEQYGFNEFFKTIGQNLAGSIKTFYFEDKRFM